MLRVCSRSRVHRLRWIQLRWQSTATSTKHEFISPTLLTRARAASDEHAKLSESLAQQFDTQIAKRVGELSQTKLALEGWDRANEAFKELQALARDSDADDELRALAVEDIEPTQSALSDASSVLTASLVPPHPFADLGCMIEIRPGAGGSEAGLFAGDLYRMYRSFCSQERLPFVMLKFDTGTLSSGETIDANGPVQEAVIEIDAPGAYGRLRCEAGVHRVQRVPATESKGRTHTSAASVLVLPSFPESSKDGIDVSDPNSDYYIDPTEVRTDVLRASGAGGQHVNKTESAVRLVHEPTNTVVSMQDFRSQHKNREKAWQLLRARLAQAKREAREEEQMNLRRSVVGVARMGRSDKVRTYNWSQQRVTDHRSGLSVHSLDDVVEGGDGLEKIMESVRRWMVDKEVEALAAEPAA